MCPHFMEEEGWGLSWLRDSHWDTQLVSGEARTPTCRALPTAPHHPRFPTPSPLKRRVLCKRSHLLDKSTHQASLTASCSELYFQAQCLPSTSLPSVKTGMFLLRQSHSEFCPWICTISMQSSGGPGRAHTFNQKCYIAYFNPSAFSV